MLEGLKRFLGIKSIEDRLEVREIDGSFYLTYEDGEPYAGPYRRARDAKGQLTRMRNTYTPASRRPRD